MERFMKGDIVVVSFPFTNLQESKHRPAMVLSNLRGNDLILCLITSKSRVDVYSVILKKIDFIKGYLKHESVIRPNVLFTIENSQIRYKIGEVDHKIINAINKKLEFIFNL